MGAKLHSRAAVMSFGPESVARTCLQYKYVVDGVWRFNPSSPVVRDEDGNLNNVLEVVDPCTSFDIPIDFDPPPSPPSRCQPGALCCKSAQQRVLASACIRGLTAALLHSPYVGGH